MATNKSKKNIASAFAALFFLFLAGGSDESPIDSNSEVIAGTELRNEPDVIEENQIATSDSQLKGD